MPVNGLEPRDVVERCGGDPGAGAVSVVADGGRLFDLLPRINRAFGLSADQIDELDEQSKQQILLLAGKAGNAFIGRMITEKLIAAVLARVGARVTVKSAASFVPFVGSAIAAGIGFALTRGLGNSHVEDCYRIARQLLNDEADPTAPAAAA